MTIFLICSIISHVARTATKSRGVAQLVAHVLWEHGAGGSNPFTPTRLYPVHVAPWSRGLRHRPFTAVTRVRIPAESPFCGFRIRPWAFSSVGQSGRLITDWSRVRVPEGPPFGPVVQLVRTPACHAGGHGFEPHSGRQFCPAGWAFAGVAQLAEQLICNQQVAGSSPFASSTFFPAARPFAPGLAWYLSWVGSRVAKGSRL